MDKFEKYLADAADTSKTRYSEFSKSIAKADELAVKDYATLLIAESELFIYQNVLEVYRSHMNSKGH